ncbi:MAG TPA: DUF3010 family protein [Telmatospirillum sp.]|nr:DUF3010 family protein [Telmatospirillum sp.]
MTVCGIDIRGKDIILAIGKLNAAGHFQGTAAPGKIPIADENDPGQLRAVKAALEALLREHQVERIGIKARPNKGQFAAGAASFKLEAIIQLNEVCPATILHPMTIKAALKKAIVLPPPKINKYAEDALQVAATIALKTAAL